MNFDGTDFFPWITYRYIPKSMVQLPQLTYQSLEGFNPNRDIKLWKNLQKDYLSEKERFCLGIRLMQEDLAKEKIPNEMIMNYFEETHHELGDAILLAKSIWLFHYSLKTSFEKQRKTLFLCRSLLQDIKEPQLKVYVSIWLGLVEAALNNLPKATSYLIRLSKEVENPSKVYYAISNIFLELGMPRVSKFYKIRYKNAALNL